MKKKKRLFGPKPLLLKQLLYAFSQKNKVFEKILGIDQYLSSCVEYKGFGQAKIFSENGVGL